VNRYTRHAPLADALNSFDYTGFSDTSRASIQMTHSAFGPTVSLEEAQRLERESAEHLLRARKLSLIVDLDQTIVHATVDPTVGEWIAEGEEWEARRAHKADTGEGTSADSSSESASNLDDECNPNWDALKDVRKFRLGPASFIPPHLRGRVKGKQKLGENEGCMYYIKPRCVLILVYRREDASDELLARPGLPAFLEETAKKYEMHVYTMGTRAYAEEVCTAIDPNGKLFGGRLLSRDESDSEFRVLIACRSIDGDGHLQASPRKVYNDCFRVIRPWWSSSTTGRMFGIGVPTSSKSSRVS
jgi:RNA polymerase II subunit A-like phosphatase